MAAPRVSFDFDQIIDRTGSQARKLDGRNAKFGTADVVPLWIADMDFAAPPCVVAAVQARAAHPIYGYTSYPASARQAQVDWCARRHHWAIEPDWIVPATGVLAALSAALQAVTSPGDAVIVQPPVFNGFFHAVSACGRQLVFNPLREAAGRYTMDLAQLEQCAQRGARALLLCNPHNPLGRAWHADELAAVLAIARRHDLVIVSDEVHADLALPGECCQPLAALARPDDRLVTLTSPSKTFNLQGLGLASVIVAQASLREAVANTLDRLHLTAHTPFAVVAAEAAWRGGDAWLDALGLYLAGNRDAVTQQLRASLPALRVAPCDAGYLLWLDCRALGLDDAALRDFFVQRQLGLNAGADYGPGGSGCMRLNIGSPRAGMLAALGRLAPD